MKHDGPKKNRPWNSGLNFTLRLAVLIAVCGLSIRATESEDVQGQESGESEETVELQITIADVREEVGTIHLGVYTTKEEWKDLEPTHKMTSEPSTPNVTVSLELVPGEYAVSAYHDINDDEEFNRKGVLRLPGEPFAFSNDPKIRAGVPSWKRVKFSVGNEDTEHTLTFKHP